MQRIKPFALLFIFAFLLGMANHAYAQEHETLFIDFSGELIDQNASPVSGVLSLQFKIYAKEKDRKAIATETHYLSVVDGKYKIILGEQSVIKSSASTFWVGVELQGKELMRQEVSAYVVLRSPNSLKDLVTEEVGLRRGEEFTLKCPSGYMVTGITGTKQDSVQSLKLICTKIFD